VKVNLLHGDFKQLVATKIIRGGSFIRGGEYFGMYYYTDQLTTSQQENNRTVTPTRKLNGRQVTLIPSDNCKAAVANDVAHGLKLKNLRQTNNAFIWEEFCPLVELTNKLFLRLYAIADIQIGEVINWRYGLEFWEGEFPLRPKSWVRKNYSPITNTGTLLPLEIQQRFLSKSGLQAHKGHEECQLLFMSARLDMPLHCNATWGIQT
jgi:hypothetical protein